MSCGDDRGLPDEMTRPTTGINTPDTSCASLCSGGYTTTRQTVTLTDAVAPVAAEGGGWMFGGRDTESRSESTTESDAVPAFVVDLVEDSPDWNEEPEFLCSRHKIEQPTAANISSRPVAGNASNGQACRQGQPGIMSCLEPVQVQLRPADRSTEPDEEYFDIFMVYYPEDEEIVCKLKAFLQRFVSLGDGQAPKILMDTCEMSSALGGQKPDLLARALSISGHAFIVCTNSGKEDPEVKFKRNVALWNRVKNGSKACQFVPVKMNRSVVLGKEMEVFASLDVSSLLRDGRVLGLVDIDNLERASVNMDAVRRVQRSLIAKRKECFLGTVLPSSNSSKTVPPSTLAHQPPTLTQNGFTSHTNIIQNNFDYLVDRIDPDSGLVTHLFSSETLSQREREDVEAEKTRSRRNEKLLSIIYTKDARSFENFLLALSTSNQSFIADRLRKLSEK